MPHLASPQVFVSHLLSINYIPFLLQTSYNDRVCFLFTRGRQVEEDGLNVGISTSALHCNSFICHDIAFLLVLAGEEATGDRKYGLSTTWVNPCQTRTHSMEEAIGNLTTWVSSEPDWPYALVWLHKDTCHASLPKEGHLGLLPQRGAEMTACRRISQLEVCQLIISGLQVAYLIGLNGCKEPIITSLPESLANGISLTRGESIYLEIDILQSLAEELD